MKESLKDKKQRVPKIIRALKKRYPDAKCSLNYKNPLELLVATQLSAQCTDKRVNIVTKDLFKKYKKARDYARASLTDLEKDVKSTGFYKNKAKNLKKTGESLEKDHGGEVPEDFESLTKLSGVGRKTAHVVMGNAFNLASGVVVDTHVKRLSNRLGLVKSENPDIIEKKLCEIIPKKDWILFSHLLIELGREICLARKPHCGICFLSKLCPRLIK